MSQAGSAVGGGGSKAGGSKAGGSHFSNTSSFHQSAMAMTGDSVTLPPGGIKHPQRFQSFVGPKRESVRRLPAKLPAHLRRPNLIAAELPAGHTGEPV